MINFTFLSKTVFHCLPAVDSQTLPISKMEIFMTIGNEFQPLTIVAKMISAGFPNLYMTVNYQRWLLTLLTFLTSFRLFFKKKIFFITDLNSHFKNRQVLGHKCKRRIKLSRKGYRMKNLSHWWLGNCTNCTNIGQCV